MGWKQLPSPLLRWLKSLHLPLCDLLLMLLVLVVVLVLFLILVEMEEEEEEVVVESSFDRYLRSSCE